MFESIRQGGFCVCVCFFSLRLIFLIVYHLKKHWLGPYFSANTNAFADKRVHLLPIDFYCFAEMKSKLFFYGCFLKDETRTEREETNSQPSNIHTTISVCRIETVEVKRSVYNPEIICTFITSHEIRFTFYDWNHRVSFNV